MMPMRPASFTQKARCFIAWLNTAAWQIVFLLPRLEALMQELQNFCLALQVMRVGSTVTPESCSRPIGLGDGFYPANAVETLLKHIVETGHEIIVLPQPQAVRCAARGPTVP